MAKYFFVIVLAAVLQAQVAFPGKDWQKAGKPEDLGFSSARLDALRGWLKTQKTTALHVSVGGQVVFEYGNVAQVSKISSIRASILAMLFGAYFDNDKADPNQTVEQLGLQDVDPFVAIERNATLLHLMTLRSGIYHAAGNEDLLATAPRRGSQAPGTFMQYQNWDFNALGTAFAKISGKDVYSALAVDLAKPLGMQDFDAAKQKKLDLRPESVHPDYPMYLSTRDLARLGVLMLADGKWGDKQVLPEGWTTRITTLVTPQAELHPVPLAMRTRTGSWGYGMLWWVWDAPIWPQIVTGPMQGAYSAMGVNGQYLTVLPAMGMVISHKVDFEADGTPEVTPGEFHAILQMLIESRVRQQ